MLVDGFTFRRLVRARELLATGAHDVRSVREIAISVGISPYRFIRVFDAVFGITPHQFRTGERVSRAKDLLAAGTTVTDACLEVGFSSIGSFSGLFARWVGAPPSAYRRSVAVPRNFAPFVIPGCLGMLAQLPANAWSNSREARCG
jgi:AraC-like DNA-binding protein